MNNEMYEGYRDGLNPDSPKPSNNRSASYLHGFANGRDDLLKRPRATAQLLREAAMEAEKLDRARKDANAWWDDVDTYGGSA